VFGTPEGRAWGILLTAFAVFCALVVSVPLGIRWYIVNTMDDQLTILEEPIDGAVYVKEPRSTDYIRVTQRHDELAEGSTVTTDERLRAFLRLFDGSTLTLYNDTEIVLERVRSPRFEISPRPNEIQVRVERGRVAIGVASPLDRELDASVLTPHARVLLEEGSFSVVVDESQTELTIRPIRPGEARVITAKKTLRLNSGRCRVTADGQIEGPLPQEKNLIVNGDFDAVLDRGWEAPEQQRQDENDPFGEARVVALEGQNILAFTRQSATTHGETSIIQFIDKDVRDFESLRLSCEVLVNHQSLAGGGYESTEFPVMIELRYRDSVGNPRSRYWGFYYLDPGTGPEWRTMVNGIKVVQGEWYPFETENLMQDQSMRDIRPAHVDAVRVYASGWDWDSAITNIALLVQE